MDRRRFYFHDSFKFAFASRFIGCLVASPQRAFTVRTTADMVSCWTTTIEEGGVDSNPGDCRYVALTSTQVEQSSLFAGPVAGSPQRAYNAVSASFFLAYSSLCGIKAADQRPMASGCRSLWQPFSLRRPSFEVASASLRRLPGGAFVRVADHGVAESEVASFSLRRLPFGIAS